MKLFIALLLLLIPFTSFKNKDKVPPHKDVISESYIGNVKRVTYIANSEATSSATADSGVVYKSYDSTIRVFDKNGFLTDKIIFARGIDNEETLEHEKYHYSPDYKNATIEIYNKNKEKVLTRYLSWVGDYLKTIRTYTDDSAVIRIDSIHHNKEYRADTISHKFYGVSGNFEVEYFSIVEFNEYGGTQTLIFESYDDINREHLSSRLVSVTTVYERDERNNAIDFEYKIIGSGIRSTSKAIQRIEYYE